MGVILVSSEVSKYLENESILLLTHTLKTTSSHFTFSDFGLPLRLLEQFCPFLLVPFCHRVLYKGFKFLKIILRTGVRTISFCLSYFWQSRTLQPGSDRADRARRRSWELCWAPQQTWASQNKACLRTVRLPEYRTTHSYILREMHVSYICLSYRQP